MNTLLVTGKEASRVELRKGNGGQIMPSGSITERNEAIVSPSMRLFYESTLLFVVIYLDYEITDRYVIDEILDFFFCNLLSKAKWVNRA